MSPNEFEALLVAEKFDEVVTISREPNGSLPNHSHPFEAKALITKGQISITVDAVRRFYKAGEIFHLNAHVEHMETYGPEGVTYLVGRKLAS
jgi:quercetin dioxygenase-like cupin family protein